MNNAFGECMFGLKVISIQLEVNHIFFIAIQILILDNSYTIFVSALEVICESFRLLLNDVLL